MAARRKKSKLIRTGFQKSAFTFDPSAPGVKAYPDVKAYPEADPFPRLYFVDGSWFEQMGPKLCATRIGQAEALDWFLGWRMDIPPELAEFACSPGPGISPAQYEDLKRRHMERILGRAAQRHEPPSQAQSRDDASAYRHSPDFRSVFWFGTDYSFTATQAACVKLLWEAWKNGTPELAQASILGHSDVESDSSRLKDIFKDNPAWGTMIVKGKRRGSYRLQEPIPASSQAPPPAPQATR